jgi:hypothetical protein
MWRLPAESATCRPTPFRPGLLPHLLRSSVPVTATPGTVTGDSLFPGGPGRTTNPTDFTSLMDELESRVFGVYADDTVVHPGHGKPTTLGAERPQIPEWRARGW